MWHLLHFKSKTFFNWAYGFWVFQPNITSFIVTLKIPFISLFFSKMSHTQAIIFDIYINQICQIALFVFATNWETGWWHSFSFAYFWCFCVKTIYIYICAHCKHAKKQKNIASKYASRIGYFWPNFYLHVLINWRLLIFIKTWFVLFDHIPFVSGKSILGNNLENLPLGLFGNILKILAAYYVGPIPYYRNARVTWGIDFVFWIIKQKYMLQLIEKLMKLIGE